VEVKNFRASVIVAGTFIQKQADLFRLNFQAGHSERLRKDVTLPSGAVNCPINVGLIKDGMQMCGRFVRPKKMMRRLPPNYQGSARKDGQVQGRDCTHKAICEAGAAGVNEITGGQATSYDVGVDRGVGGRPRRRTAMFHHDGKPKTLFIYGWCASFFFLF
jgi:hypothetical protein